MGGFEELVAGGRHSCGLLAGGRVRCWGVAGVSRNTPGLVFTQVDAPESHVDHACGVTVARLGDATPEQGTVLCWGGDGVAVPRVVQGDFIQVATGSNSMCGLRPDERVVCWDNATGGPDVYASARQPPSAGCSWILWMNATPSNTTAATPTTASSWHCGPRRCSASWRSRRWDNDGNDADDSGPPNQQNSPAVYPDVISVASINEDGQRSSFSTANSLVDIAAPGGKILSSVPLLTCEVDDKDSDGNDEWTPAGMRHRRPAHRVHHYHEPARLRRGHATVLRTPHRP